MGRADLVAARADVGSRGDSGVRGRRRGPGEAIAMCLALAGVYLVVGTVFLRLFERLARDRATLSLT